MSQSELLSPCGMYCGVCAIHIAHKTNDNKFKEKLGPAYGVTPEEIACEGCLSDKRFKYCQVCPIRSCTVDKGYEGCHQCGEFPCELIDQFPVAVGKRVILRSVPARRDLGTEKWLQGELNRYHCPSCGNDLFRGAKRCRNCKESVDVD
ncbi:DUF3795 domain-containing protein [Thermodesulfobacteriota bacterium]